MNTGTQIRTAIPVLDLSPEIQEHWDEFMAAIEGVLRSGIFILGPNVKAFEQEIASWLGVKHAIGVNSGTDALVIALRALGIGPGDEVITTPFTFIATSEAADQVGATPVFVDVDPKTFNIDPALIEEKITPRTKVILPVHLFGQAANMGEIMALAKRHNLKVVEDVAQALGGEYNGAKLGTIGQAGIFSFFPSKNLGAFGDGGMVVTNDEAVAEQARMLRGHGSRKKYFNEIMGYNSRLDEIQAAILRVKLRHVDSGNEGRRKVAGAYDAQLADFDGIVTPYLAPLAKHVYHQYTIRVLGGRRDQVRERLSAAGVGTMIYYPVPLHRLPVYANRKVALPVSESAAAEVLSLPIWPQMTEKIQRQVVSELRANLTQRI